MKSKPLAATLAFFLGGLGVHKFYLGKTAAGILYLVFYWTFIPAVLGAFDALVIMGTTESSWVHQYGAYAGSGGPVDNQKPEPPQWAKVTSYTIVGVAIAYVLIKIFF